MHAAYRYIYDFINRMPLLFQYYLELSGQSDPRFKVNIRRVNTKYCIFETVPNKIRAGTSHCPLLYFQGSLQRPGIVRCSQRNARDGRSVGNFPNRFPDYCVFQREVYAT